MSTANWWISGSQPDAMRGPPKLFNVVAAEKKDLIGRFAAVNKLNPEMPIHQSGSASVLFSSITTGNMMGFDVWVSDGSAEAALNLRTNRGELTLKLAEIGLEPALIDVGGLARKLTVQRLPNDPLPREVALQEKVDIAAEGDTSIWLCVTFEDGNQA